MTLNVIDIASYQNKLIPSKVSTDAIIIKATQATNYVNPTWKTQANQTLAAGKKLGLYHFVREGINGATQADYFLAQASEFVGKAILILDFENEKNSKNVTISDVRNAAGLTIAKAFLDRVYDQTGVRLLIYTNTDFERHLDFSEIVKGNYGLWIAQYRTMSELHGFQPHAYPYKLVHWPNLVMYQYSSNTVVPGYGAGIDVSIFYGDGKAWDAYAKASKSVTSATVAQSATTTKPAASGDYTDELGVVWHKQTGTFTPDRSINLRMGARATSTLIATIKAGQSINYDQYVYSGGYVWIRQPRGNGQYGYMVTGQASGSKRVNRWGKFK